VKRKVGFQELFYDLFLVAALSVFSGDNDLDRGPDIGAYVVFFAALWAIWASQTVFDVCAFIVHDTCRVIAHAHLV
jgi:low temperature requirement protein LtrA